jgi:membrane associated rhomboid family serine protease
MDLIENLKQSFRSGSTVIRLIYFNAAVFLIYNAAVIFLTLFKVSIDLTPYLAVPASFHNLLSYPWTIITYMFMHKNFMHILFNMIALYWFGKIFTMYFTEKQLIGLYVSGGIAAALLYILSFNIFPYFEDVIYMSSMIGASGSVMAIMVASAVKSPDMELRLLLFGNVKLKYIAIVFMLISFFGITSMNAGGEIAHLGGALFGYFFVVSLRQGRDITSFVNKIIDFLVDVFTGKKIWRKKLKTTRPGRKMSDGDYNAAKAQNMAEIDKILDKIKKSGYESLTAEEKKRLFDQGKR